jgi:hypothetical protein
MKREILKATLVAGTLDILGAFAYNYAIRKTPPDIILKYIASGILGKTAFSGGGLYSLIGLLCHFLIVLACVMVYFKLYPRISFLQKSILVSAMLIAIVAWAITTRLIVPLSKIGTSSLQLGASLAAIAILFICIGLPIAFFARQYFKLPRTTQDGK